MACGSGSSNSMSDSVWLPEGKALSVLASPVLAWAEGWLALRRTLGALLAYF